MKWVIGLIAADIILNFIYFITNQNKMAKLKELIEQINTNTNEWAAAQEEQAVELEKVAAILKELRDNPAGGGGDMTAEEEAEAATKLEQAVTATSNAASNARELAEKLKKTASPDETEIPDEAGEPDEPSDGPGQF